MKKYQTPSLEEILFSLQDVITSSSEIVSTSDKEGAAETQESTWDDTWN